MKKYVIGSGLLTASVLALGANPYSQMSVRIFLFKKCISQSSNSEIGFKEG